MTYCVALLVKEGLVMLADTRTNAGLDNISTFSKLHVFETPGERVIGVMTAGNLAVTQSALSVLAEGLPDPNGGPPQTLLNAPTMFEAARRLGRAMRDVYDQFGAGMEAQSISFDATFLLAGQIQGERPRLFQVYSAGNFIEATVDTPYLQIGEHKYGKPILDRVARVDTPLGEAVKLALISMDSTLRSNLSVGLPIDLLVLRRDELQAALRLRLDEGDAYLAALRAGWSAALRDAYRALPAPSWLEAVV